MRLKRLTFFRGMGIRCLTVRVTSNKFLEAQVGRFTPAPEWFRIHLEWNRMRDHAGIEAEISVWGCHLMLKLYDVRHWDDVNNRWEKT